MKASKLTKTLALLLAIICFAGFLPVQALGESEWKISSDTNIYWVETNNSNIQDADLKAQVQLFAQELSAKELTDAVLDISYGAKENAGNSDIVLLLDASQGIAAEGYKISITDGQLVICASDADGLFYGCRYVEQAMLQQSGLTVGKTYSDKPDCAERGFFLDCGRKYYSPEWIKDMIKEISWSNMNAIYLHFSEEMGFRLESKTYPWLAGADNTLCVNGSDSGIAADNDKYITQDEMREIAEVAKLYHVEIIPSLDSPGHMNYAVKKYNAQYGTDIGNYFHYNGQTAIVQGSGPENAQKNYSRGIDISNSEAVTFAQNLYKEYAEFFRELGCTKFDIGGDELLGWGAAVTTSVSKWKQLDHWKIYAQNRAKQEGKSNYSDAVAYDAFMYYMNDIYDIVSSYGYTSVRMWNDDALRTNDTGYQQVVELNKNVEIQYWTPDANSGKNNIWTYLNQGYKAYNFLNSYSYYVLGNSHTDAGSGSYEGCTPQRIYENWNPYVFAPYGDTNTGKNTSIGNSNIKGSAFCVWCDNPNAETAADVKNGVLPLLRSNGAKTWDADINESIDYSVFETKLKKIGNVPTNLPDAPDVYEIPDDTALKDAILQFSQCDSSLYTDDSFEAYAKAVSDGKAVLEQDKPIQEDIDSAVEAIAEAKAALIEKSNLDYTQLNAELEKFSAVKREEYTEETYRAYQLAAQKAEELKSDASAMQEDIDDAAQRLVYLHEQLQPADMVSTEEWLLSFASKSASALHGKEFIFAAIVTTKADIVGFQIYDELGNRVDLTAILWGKPNAKTPEQQVVQMKIRAVGVGTHTYTIFAIDGNGYRSADSRSVTVRVK